MRDNYLVGNLPSYEEKELVSIDRADLELEQIENNKKGLDDPSMLSLCEWMKETLGEKRLQLKVYFQNNSLKSTLCIHSHRYQ